MLTDTKPVSKLSIVSWALYDLANTIFSFNIISIHMALWVVNDMGGTDSQYAFANSLSMFMVIFTAPLLGAMSDQSGRRIPFLAGTTILCVIFTLFLGQGGLSTSLIIFVIANYMFQSGLVFYDALLPAVSNDKNRGKVGAFGVGLGYVGSLIAVITGIILFDTVGRIGMFQMTAGFFLIFSIPCFLFVKDTGTGPIRFGKETLKNSLIQLKLTLSKTNQFPGLRRFFIGRVFYADTVNTLILFMGIYVTNELGFTDDQVQQILAFAIVSAIIGAPIWGIVVDRIGPKKTLNAVLVMWMVILAGIAAIPIFGFDENLMWYIAPIAGVAIGGTWCADRPYLVRLVSPQYIGEMFGVYSMTGRFGSVAGPFMWAMVAEKVTVLGVEIGFNLGRPVAVISLLVLIVVSYFILSGVSDNPSKPAPNANE